MEESKIRDRKALERLYLVVALALLFATSQGMAVQLAGLRQRVDPHSEMCQAARYIPILFF